MRFFRTVEEHENFNQSENGYFDYETYEGDSLKGLFWTHVHKLL